MKGEKNVQGYNAACSIADLFCNELWDGISPFIIL